MGIIFAILIFSIVVAIHELGHFLFAKWNGIYVFEFSLGMGPTIFHKTIGETKYCIKLLPLGGSCMMGEDAQETEDKEQADEVEEEVKFIGNFNEKSVWARISVIFGGPLFNFILAFICALIMVAWMGYDAAEIGHIQEGSAAYEAGLIEGDLITKIDNKKIHLWREVSTYLQVNPTDYLQIEIIRDNEKFIAEIYPQYVEEEGRYFIGISGTDYKTGGISDTLKYSVYTVKYYMLSVIDSLKMMLSGMVSVEEVSGPVGIVDQVGQSYEASIEIGFDVVLLNMLYLLVLLSANLGVMNLLPIPALDGGRLVFLVIEAIRGKRMAPEKEGLIHFLGFVALMIFMAFIMYNDISRLF